MKEAANADDMKEWSLYICQFDRPNYFIESVLCKPERVTKIIRSLWAVHKAHKKQLKSYSA